MVDEKKPAAPAAPESEPAPVSLGIDALIDRWHLDNFHGTRAGNDVDIWNLIFKAKEDLKLRLAAHQEK